MKSGPNELPLTQAGVARNRFRLASGPTDLGGGLLMGEMVDQYTDRSFALWFLPSTLAGDSGRVDSLEARVAASIGIGDRRILRSYGLHSDTATPALRVEASREPRLAEAALAEQLRKGTPSATIRWLHEVAEALDNVATDHALVHGAVSPFWVRLASDGTPRLDGIAFAAAFADAGACKPEDIWFSSPARRRKEQPDVADDVFGVAALAFWALAGGVRTEDLPQNAIQLDMIDSLRRTRGLPPTGFQQGWDAPIVAGLSSSPALRPATPTSLTAQLRALLPDVPGNTPAGAGAPIRRPPPWRDLARANGSGNGAHAAGNGVAGKAPDAITERIGLLRRLESELQNARQGVANGLRENTLQRARLQADLAAVARSADEIESTRQKLDAAERNLNGKLDKVQERERTLDERERAAEARDVSIGARESSVVGRETSAEAKRVALKSLEEELQSTAADLERSGRELTEARARSEAREQELERSEKELSARRVQLALELEQLSATRQKLESEAKELHAGQQTLQQKQAEVARSEAGFAAREQVVAAREQNLKQGEAELAATREKSAAERADIGRLILEHKTVIDKAKNAETRIEAARVERARIDQELAAHRADLAAYEQAIKRREETLEGRKAELERREEATARREAMFGAVDIALQAGGEPLDADKLLAELLARKRGTEERENQLALEAAELEKNKAELTRAIREKDRERKSIADAQQKLERERSALAEKAQVQAREQKAWEAEKQEQQNTLTAHAAEAEAVSAKLLLRGAVQNVLAETSEASVSRPPPPPPQVTVRRPSPIWAVAAVVATVSALTLGFMFFRMSGTNDRLHQALEATAKKTLLVITTDPPDAEISIAGRAVQRSPARFEDLPPGSVTVSVSKEGYVRADRSAVIVAGKPVVMPTIVLGPPPLPTNGTGTLLVRTKPTGALVTLGVPGVAPQRSPWLFKNLPPGDINVTVRLDNYNQGGGFVPLTSNDYVDREFVLTLTPPPPVVGWLSVSTKPEDAEVEIDGQLIPRAPGGTPVTSQDLKPGPVTVLVKRAGYEPRKETLVVERDKTKPLVIELRAIPPPVVIVKEPAPPPKPPPAEVQLPSSLVVKFDSADPIRMLMIPPPGEISIGATTANSTKVRVTHPFLIATGEVTQGQYKEVMKINPSQRAQDVTKGKSTKRERVLAPPMTNGTPAPPQYVYVPEPDVNNVLSNNPVEMVTWENAMEFCRILTERYKGSILGGVFRLPTDAEWWAAAKSPLFEGGVNSSQDNPAWFAERAKGGGHRPLPTRSDAVRVYDLFGNVAEWCLDAWSEQLPQADASNPLTADEPLQRFLGSPIENYSIRTIPDALGGHVVNGGSFRNPEGRFFRRPGTAAAPDVGFRIVLGYPVGPR